METNVDQTSYAAPAPPPARPQFLTVLCILTWICCGLMFITTIYGVIAQKSPEEQYEQIEKIREMSPEAADKMEAMLEEQKGGSQVLGTAITLVALAFSALGASLMWQLRRRGFYFYVAGETLPYLGFAIGGAEAVSMVSSMGGAAATMAGIAIAAMVIFDIVFIGMYAANLKHMKS